jgi:hypothetical protein
VLFFPDPPGGTEQAARMCAMCPVQPDCLADALKTRDIYGFRGGHTGEERARMLRRTAMRAEAKPVPVGDVSALLAMGWTCPAIAARLDVHVDSVRRVRRKLAKEQEAAA